MTEKTPDKKLARIDIKLLNNTAREFLRLKLTLESDLGMKITNTQVVEHMLHTMDTKAAIDDE
jgi:hypothetical protein